jgi:hypothetical protein
MHYQRRQAATGGRCRPLLEWLLLAQQAAPQAGCLLQLPL